MGEQRRRGFWNRQKRSLLKRWHIAFPPPEHCYGRGEVLAGEMERGLRLMRSSSACICFLIRNGADFLRRNIADLQTIQDSFRSCEIVAVENDSIDDTAEVLQCWRDSRQGIRILSEKISQTDNFSGARPGVMPSYSAFRIGRMAAYRNKFLEYVESAPVPADYLLVLDIDVHGIPLASVVSAFGQEVEWDAMTGNMLCFHGLAHGYIYYDGYALSPLGSGQPHSYRRMLENMARFSGLRPGMPPIRVESAFNGLAVYRMSALRGCRYEVLPNADPQVEVLCEHTALHRQMAAKGHDRIYVNPGQLLYVHRWQDWLRSLL